MHIEVDLAGASSLLRIEPGMISTLSALSVAPPQLREKFEKPNCLLYHFFWKTIMYDLKLDLCD